ncbi:hydroxyneurosporene synthase [Colletotrichum higginsianum]|nr:hydroxyneurosporene synthase [Colletotrichum higginsianum]
MASIGIKGNVVLKSRALARYPCNFNVPGVNQELLPHLSWSNAVPDAEATVNLDINGTSLSFSNGIGYYDKNWGDAPVYTKSRSWDWGHARFGPYSVVWFDILDRTNTERFHAFVAKDGNPVLLSCADSILQVRQWGGDAAYPPVSGLGHVDGLTARFTLEDGQVLVANVTTDLLIENLGGGIFTRAIGSVKGGVVGQEIFEGRAMYDENIFG